MYSKTEIGLTQHRVVEDPSPCNESLLQQFAEQTSGNRLAWSTSLRLCELKGAGGQGHVYRAVRHGADGFAIPVAVKFFSPEIYCSPQAYDQAMAAIGQIVTIVASIRHENLLVVNHFLNQDRIRVMVMEWIDGFDLRELLTSRMYGCVEERCSKRRWGELNQTLFRRGAIQPRLRIEAVLCVIRDCLSALSALHDEGVLHNDLKPSNIMLNRAGRAKVIDVGSASLAEATSRSRTFTPGYSAPEVLQGRSQVEPSSDIASLGYVALEMLFGKSIGNEKCGLPELIKAKQGVPKLIASRLLAELEQDRELEQFFCKLTHPETDKRYQSAEEALFDCLKFFGRYDCEKTARCSFRVWISELLETSSDAPDPI